MKITLTEIDSTIERSNQWTQHREAMQIMGTALRAHNDGRRLGDILTAQQMVKAGHVTAYKFGKSEP